MKRFAVCLSLSILTLTSFNLAFGVDTVQTIEGINEDQPIFVGEMVYEDNVKVVQGSSYAFYHVKYTYIGFDNNSIRIRYDYKIDDATTKDRVKTGSDILILPLDTCDTTYLRMERIPKWPHKAIIPAKILYIELNDRDNFTISVREDGKVEQDRY